MDVVRNLIVQGEYLQQRLWELRLAGFTFEPSHDSHMDIVIIPYYSHCALGIFSDDSKHMYSPCICMFTHMLNSSKWLNEKLE